MFWGVIIIAAGLVIIINQFFKLNLPVMRITFGIFLIMLGVNFLGGWKYHLHPNTTTNEVVFGSKTMVYSQNEKEYNIVFGDATIDMSGIDKNTQKPVKINCVFGSAKIYLASSVKLSLESDVAFGNIDNQFKSETNPDSNAVVVKMHANAIFGEIKILKK